MTSNIVPPDSGDLGPRKKAHIELASSSQTSQAEVDRRFDYEPLFFAHPTPEDTWESTFLDFKLNFPLWISSMTGGTDHARTINQNLAKLCGKYKLGMGLGSCRSLLSSNERLQDFQVKNHMEGQPLFANIGIAQVESLVSSGKIYWIHEMVKKVEADGLIIHLNPLQEWFQPEGDRYKLAPLATLEKFLEDTGHSVIVKEVGQGMGPKSLKALLDLPLKGIEFGAFGGTNFSLLESMRGKSVESKEPFIRVGHTAEEMVDILNALPKRDKQFIISGGIRTVLDGYELKKKLQAPALIGMAQFFLGPAKTSFELLEQHFLTLREALLTARGLLNLKGEK